MKHFLIYTLVVFALAACGGGTAWYGEKPEKRVVTVNSFKWTVEPIDKKNRYDVYSDSLTISADVEKRQADQIKAVELVTGCKVKNAGLVTGTFRLRTKVRC